MNLCIKLNASVTLNSHSVLPPHWPRRAGEAVAVVTGPRDVVEGAPWTGVDVGQWLFRAAPVALGAGYGVTGIDWAVVPLRAVRAWCAACLVRVLASDARSWGGWPSWAVVAWNDQMWPPKFHYIKGLGSSGLKWTNVTCVLLQYYKGCNCSCLKWMSLTCFSCSKGCNSSCRMWMCNLCFAKGCNSSCLNECVTCV